MNRQGGFTLIEILITTLVFSLGLLGVSALSAKGQQVTYNAYQSQLANWQIYDLIEKMRLNPDRSDDYKFDPATQNKTDYDTQGCINDTSDSDGCTPAQLAEHQLRTWLDSTSSLLPGGSGAISEDGAVANRYTITVSWDGGNSLAITVDI